MIIYKFGGTSVGKPERMHEIAKLIKDQSSVIVVLSALSGTTNALVAIGEQLIANNKHVAKILINDLRKHYATFISALYSTHSKRDEANTVVNKYFKEIDALSSIPDFNQGNNKTILAYGEILSTNLFIIYLSEINVKAKLLNALDFMCLTEDGEPNMPLISGKLTSLVKNDASIFITQGFICRNHTGQTDNLQRGGSDYSASLIGAAIGAQEVQIWTDIDGMHNNDPRIVKNTRPIAHLTFDEAAELAYFGAKILHPSSILPAQQKGIPVLLKNTMDPKALGTTISHAESVGDIKAIAAKDGITAIKIKSTRMLLAHGFLRRIFEVFEKYKTSIDMITTSEVAVSVTIDTDEHINQIIEELEQFGTVATDKNQTIVCIVGSLVSEKKGLVKSIFNALADVPVRMVSYGGSKNNISLLISSEDKIQALINLNNGLFK